MSSAVPVIDPAAYLSETEVEDRWRFLKPGEMRRARNRGMVAFYAFPAGPHYTAEAVQEYLDRRYRRSAAWPTESKRELTSEEEPSDGNSEGIISKFLTPIAAASTTPAAMTPELALSAAEACVQRMARKQSRPSSPSSQPRQRVQLANAQGRAKS